MKKQSGPEASSAGDRNTSARISLDISQLPTDYLKWEAQRRVAEVGPDRALDEPACRAVDRLYWRNVNDLATEIAKVAWRNHHQFISDNPPAKTDAEDILDWYLKALARSRGQIELDR